MLRLTPVIKNLMIINVMVFIAQAVAPVRDFAYCIEGLQDMYPIDAITGFLSMWNVRTDCFRPYQLFTYMFVHGGFMHLFFNMLTLAFLGPMVESVWGAKRFTIFYTVTGIGAGLFNIFVDTVFGLGSFGTMVGASGAIYGVLMAYGMLFPNMEIMLLIPPIPIKAKYLVFVLGGMTFLLDRSGSVAHFTHLGGIIFAFILIRLWRSQGGGSYY